MIDYFAKKNGLLETNVDKYNELIESINSSISTYECMNADDENCESFDNTASKLYKKTM